MGEQVAAGTLNKNKPKGQFEFSDQGVRPWVVCHDT